AELENYASLVFNDPDDDQLDTVNAPSPVSVTIDEPILEITKSAIDFRAEIMAGSEVTYEIEVAHAGNSSADAYEVIISDPANSQLNNVSNVAVLASGISVPSYEVVDGTLRVPATADGGFDL